MFGRVFQYFLHFFGDRLGVVPVNAYDDSFVIRIFTQWILYYFRNVPDVEFTEYLKDLGSADVDGYFWNTQVDGFVRLHILIYYV